MQLTINKRLGLSAEDVWTHFADFSGVARFHPFVETADQLSEQNEGVGARRKCNFYDGNSVVEKIIEWEQGRRMNVELSEMSMPMKRATVEFIVVPHGDHESDIAITMNFTPKFGLVGAMMGAMMMKLTQVLSGLEHHVRTGETIGRGGGPRSAGAMKGTEGRPATA